MSKSIGGGGVRYFMLQSYLCLERPTSRACRRPNPPAPLAPPRRQVGLFFLSRFALARAAYRFLLNRCSVRFLLWRCPFRIPHPHADQCGYRETLTLGLRLPGGKLLVRKPQLELHRHPPS